MVEFPHMHDFSLFYSPFGGGFSAMFIPFIALVALWTIVLKAYALWFAARSNQKWWFIALLVINTLGILEIVYLIWFRQGASNNPSPTSSASAPTPVVSSTPVNDSSKSGQA